MEGLKEDTKSLLHQFLRKKLHASTTKPVYSQVSKEGPKHGLLYTEKVTIELNGQSYSEVGKATSIKRAQRLAAKSLMETLQNILDSDPDTVHACRRRKRSRSASSSPPSTAATDNDTPTSSSRKHQPTQETQSVVTLPPPPNLKLTARVKRRRCYVCGSGPKGRTLISCVSCGYSSHPVTCLGYPLELILIIQTYPWQCCDCKQCQVCGSAEDEDQLLLCDDCDRSYHTYCIDVNKPTGSWICGGCI